MERSPSETKVSLLVKKFQAYYGTRELTTVFTGSCFFVPVLSQINPVHTASVTDFFKIQCNIILPFYSYVF